MDLLATFSSRYQSSPRSSEQAVDRSHVKFRPAGELDQSVVSNPGHTGYRCISGSMSDLAEAFACPSRPALS